MRRLLLLAVGALAACGGTTPPSPQVAPDASADAGSADAPRLDASDPDAARPDAVSAPDAGASDARADAGAAQRTLTVLGGEGGGTFAPGTPVEVWAELAPADATRFDGWSGDFAALGLRDEWHLRFEMPDRDLTLEARITPSELTIEERTYRGATSRDKTLLALVPAAPQGVLLMLHGTGGSSGFLRRTEGAAFAIAAAARGWAVLSPEAEEVVAGDLDGNQKIRWNAAPRADNLDLQSLDMLVAELETDGVVPAGLPWAVTGMSNGGAMSVTLAAVSAAPALAAAFPRLRFAAAVSFCASGRIDAVMATETPTAWLMCGRDRNENVGEAGNQTAFDYSRRLAGRGVRTDFDLHPPSAVYATRFMRVAGVDAATSQAMVADLEALGALDAQGVLQMTSAEIIAAIQAEPRRAPNLARPPTGTGASIRSQIDVMYADHSFFSDWAQRTLDFIE